MILIFKNTIQPTNSQKKELEKHKRKFIEEQSWNLGDDMAKSTQRTMAHHTRGTCRRILSSLVYRAHLFLSYKVHSVLLHAALKLLEVILQGNGPPPLNAEIPAQLRDPQGAVDFLEHEPLAWQAHVYNLPM
jgi:hypothetical protein